MASRDLLYISLKEATSSSFSPAWRPACSLMGSWTHHSGIREERSAGREDTFLGGHSVLTNNSDLLSKYFRFICCVFALISTLPFHSQGKVFPKLRKRSPHNSCDSVSDKEDDEATDYVFRILFPGNQMEFSKCL